MMRGFLGVFFIFVLQFATAQPVIDSTFDNSMYSIDELIQIDIPELCPDDTSEIEFFDPQIGLTSEYYINRYDEEDLLKKVVDNWGNGFDSLYGARNLRPILHGVAYRGGANNYFHKTDKRKNANPLPNDGIENLCQEGFSSSVYLYRTNFETAPPYQECNCVNGTKNEMEYYQYDYFDEKHIYEMLELVYKSAKDTNQGPVYLHCWNGWHASGFISAVILKQFCGFSDLDAVAYWDLGTDGANMSPRYTSIREKIMNFKPYDEFLLEDSLGNKICPPMPEVIDSSQLHIGIEHLVIVPEAIPINTVLILEHVKFGPNKTTIPSVGSNSDVSNLLKALNKSEDLRIEIGGHTDRSGNENANRSLSTQRAKFIYDYLIRNGIAAERLTYKGYGSAKPAYTNKTKSGRAANRRIEIRILDKKAETQTLLVDEAASSLKETDPFLKTTTTSVKEILNINQGESIVLNKVVFGPNMTVLNDTAKLQVDSLATILKAHPKVVVEITGYTDKSGIPDTNIVLSNKRAQAVYDELILQNVNPSQIYFSGCGDDNPIAPNSYRWGRDINRRVEVVLLVKE